jgi:hypothetical protein
MTRLFLGLMILGALATFSAGIYDLFGEPARSGLFHSAGEAWFSLSPTSLNLMQAVTQRYVSPELWDPTIISVLKLPLVAITGLLSAFFACLWLLLRRRTAS